MTLERQLADHVLEHSPDRAATVLERMNEQEAIDAVARLDAGKAAAIVRRFSPQFSIAVLQGLGPEHAARVLGAMNVDAAARVLRRADVDFQTAVLERSLPRHARSVGTLLSFPAGTAGAMMDPDVLAVPQEFTAREALARVRSSAEHARYNVYVVDQEHRLVGAINLRELLIARGRTVVSDLMVREPHCLKANTGRAAVISHPGWRDVHALPVVDGDGGYVGAIRYKTLRALEDELLAARSADADAATALGEVVSAGARGVIGAISGVPNIDQRRTHGS